MTKITIDSKEYELDSLTDVAKAQLQNLQFVDTELAHLQAQTAVLQTARMAYADALRVALSMPVKGVASGGRQLRVTEHDVMVLALKDAGHSYFSEVLAQTPIEQHDSLIAQVEAHRSWLADFCLTGYEGAGLLTTEFIRALHQSLFPKDHRQEVWSLTDERHWLVPGQYKSVNNAHAGGENPLQLKVFLPPDQVPLAMERVVDSLNIALPAAKEESEKKEAIYSFLADFLAIHPFLDANGRVACILGDLLAIREGLPPSHFYSFKSENKLALLRAIEVAQSSRCMTLAREVFEKFRVL
jgi:fido (protein-threonine AMPylation protein)